MHRSTQEWRHLRWEVMTWSEARLNTGCVRVWWCWGESQRNVCDVFKGISPNEGDYPPKRTYAVLFRRRAVTCGEELLRRKFNTQVLINLKVSYAEVYLLIWMRLYKIIITRYGRKIKNKYFPTNHLWVALSREVTRQLSWNCFAKKLKTSHAI